MSNLFVDMSMYIIVVTGTFHVCGHTVHVLYITVALPRDYFRSFMMNYELLYGSSVTLHLFLAVVC
jgi:hypothetical protein